MRYFGDLKKESVIFASALVVLCDPFEETVKTSPAPSQSEEVMIGGCVCVKSRSAKNLVNSAILCDRNLNINELKGIRGRICGIARRYSGD